MVLFYITQINKRYAGYHRFSRVQREFSVLAEGRHTFGHRPSKDLRETGNRAGKVSGIQGKQIENLAQTKIRRVRTA